MSGLRWWADDEIYFSVHAEGYFRPDLPATYEGVFSASLSNPIPERIEPAFNFYGVNPTGTTTFSIRGQRPTYQLTIFDLETEETTIVPDILFYYWDRTDWSPNGQMLAASLCVDDDADIYVIDATTGEAVNLIDDDEITAVPNESYPRLMCDTYG